MVHIALNVPYRRKSQSDFEQLLILPPLRERKLAPIADTKRHAHRPVD